VNKFNKVRRFILRLTLLFSSVRRSVTLSSLNFLRSLHTVHGKALEMKRYSLIVYENNNLQTLWDRRAKKKIELKNGNLLFTANSKLCLHEIQMLQSIIAYNRTCNSTCDFVSPFTNGYKNTCNMDALDSESNVRATKVNSFKTKLHFLFFCLIFR
jgi:hypothetical protein